jgi:hypothetical protein
MALMNSDDDKTGEIHRVISDTLERQRPGWYRWVAVIASSLGFSLAAIGVSKVAIDREQQAREIADKRWCTIIVTLDDAYEETPPQTPAGQNVARAIKGLRGDLGCSPSLPK